MSSAACKGRIFPATVAEASGHVLRRGACGYTLDPSDHNESCPEAEGDATRATHRSQAHSPISELKICLLAFAELVTKVRPRENAP